MVHGERLPKQVQTDTTAYMSNDLLENLLDDVTLACTETERFPDHPVHMNEQWRCRLDLRRDPLLHYHRPVQRWDCPPPR